MTSRLAPKHQRMVLAVIALAALIAAGLLAAWALRNEASYYYFPSELRAAKPAPGQPGRLGGMVELGSVKRLADGVTVSFIVGDGKARVPVRYTGILPDLFVEGSGVVAEGHLQADGTFVADTLLAKHDENYVPRELSDMTAAQKRATIEETTK
jgi:cytochrome c-type biogenesis protein CcmE